MTFGCESSNVGITHSIEYPLMSLYINPTRYCNLCCRHCWVSPPAAGEKVGKGEITIREIIGVIREAKELGLTEIKLTGGEPLLRDDIEELLAYCSENKVEIFLETNGTLVTKDVAAMLLKYDVTSMSTSIDSASEDMHDYFRGKKGAYVSTVRGIRNLIAVGIYPQVIISLFRENLYSFSDFTGFMHDLGIKDVKINIISPLGRGADLKNAGEVPTLREILEFHDNIDSFRGPYRGRLSVDVPAAFKKIEEIKEKGFSVCALKRILGILSNGDVSMCGVGYMDDRLIFGNIRKDPSKIKEIWLNHPVVREIREDLPMKLEGVCGLCVFRGACLGGCRAEVFHNKGSLRAPFWLCQEAYEEGMFPSTRMIPEEIRV
ncbi:MAG: radical SAM protein [Candidatus Tantalella remota]|nr:radical SAM protein [Candidatus Tantalella remota]